jgi:TolB protein
MPKSSARFWSILRPDVIGSGVVGVMFLSSSVAGDPLQAIPSKTGELENRQRPKVYIEAFRGNIGRTAADLVRRSIERCHVFEIAPTGHSDTYTISAESTGGRIQAVIFKPGGGVLMERLYESPSLRQNAHRLTDDLTELVAAHPGIASSIVAFVSDRSGSRQVYMCDSDGYDIRRITTDPAVEAHEPCVRVSAGKFVFTGSKRGYPDIYAIDLETNDSTPTRIINAIGNNRFPALSPDASRLALTMSYSGSTDLYVTSAAGGQGRRLTNDQSIESHPTWSPDGRSIAYTRSNEKSGANSGLAVISALGGKPEVLAGISGNPTSPEWSPDGGHIAFTLDSKDGRGVALFDLKKRETAMLEGSETAHSPSWAPDSRHLVFISENALWVYEVETGVRIRIIGDFGNISDSTWSR